MRDSGGSMNWLLLITIFFVSASGQAPVATQETAPWRDPSNHQVRFVSIDGVRLEVLDWGGSGQPLVLLGCYLTAHVHDEFAPKLTNQFHVFGITQHNARHDPVLLGLRKMIDLGLQVRDELFPTELEPFRVRNSVREQIPEEARLVDVDSQQLRNLIDDDHQADA